jgi:demethylmenaquinone methyltransferase/2-methoxy-6-polyprenyl-1,4-benzoquinol methylase
MQKHHDSRFHPLPLTAYYAARAPEYEAIYTKPERQEDLAAIERLLAKDLRAREVLEVACGTGYWTERVAGVAKSIRAYDINSSVLEIARAKGMEESKVQFKMGDAYSLPDPSETFDGGFAGFWWSHVPIGRRTEFLTSFLPRFRKNAVICLFDNRYVEGSSTPIARRDEFGNTYQVRVLKDGRETEVLKNFFSEAELRDCFGSVPVRCEIILLKYYWYARLTFAH